MKNIQTNLFSAFEASGLTYDELAKRTKLPKSALYRYINGDTEKIPIDRFQTICNELNVDARSLLGWIDSSPFKLDLQIFGEQTTDEQQLIASYRSLPPAGKQYIHQQLTAARLMFGEKPEDTSVKEAE